MDARCLLSLAACAVAVAGCAARFPPTAGASRLVPPPHAGAAPRPERPSPVQFPAPPGAPPSPVRDNPTPPEAAGPFAAASPAAPLVAAESAPAQPDPGGAPLLGRRAIAAANAASRAPSRSDAFVGGVQVFAFEPGRVYEVWTAPLRVTTLTLAAGERITAKAAGDTLRWQIGETASGQGDDARAHVLVKPLQAGLETNLVLTTSRRVYLIQLRSGGADAFNAAVAWDPGAHAPPPERPDAAVPPAAAPAVVEPEGPIDARYRILPTGRAPRWTPVSVFNDGVRTFIVLDPDVRLDEAPGLFIVADGEPQLANYRQAGGVLIVDGVFRAAELRLGARRPQIVRLVHLREDGR